MLHHASRRAVAALVLACYVMSTTGCTSWKTSQGNIETVLAAQPVAPPQAQTAPANAFGGLTTADSQATGAGPVESIRISTATGASLVLHAPRIANDTVYGRLKSDAPEVAIPIADVTSVQTRQGSTGKTLGLVLGIAVPVGLVVGGMIAVSNSLSCMMGCY